MKNKPLLLGNKKKREGSVPGQDTNNYGPIYTNVISPIETPGNLMINQHIPNMMHPMGYASMGGVGGMVQNGAAIFNPMQGMKYPGNMIPPDTPISKTPGVEKENNPTRDRRRRGILMQVARLYKELACRWQVLRILLNNLL
jgi:hypothetical protein